MSYQFHLDNTQHSEFDVVVETPFAALVQTYCVNHKHSHAFLLLQQPTYILLLKVSIHVQVGYVSQQVLALAQILGPNTL